MSEDTRTDIEEIDVFLCHNSKDKKKVKEIGEKLLKQGIKVWLDEWEVPAGQSWFDAIENQIENINSAAIFLGLTGIGPWQKKEIIAILNICSSTNKPLIPVLLAGSKKPEIVPLFLHEFQWVDFNKKDPDPLESLVRGIRREKSRPMLTAITFPAYRQTDRQTLTGAEQAEVSKNRKEDLEKIQQLLNRHERGILISGVKGVGKSTIAAWFLKQEDFWLDFRAKTIDLFTLLLLLAQWLGNKSFEAHLKNTKEVGNQEIDYLFEKLVTSKRKIYFDNLETLLDTQTREFADAEVGHLFERLFEKAHGCSVLITTRIVPVMDSGQEFEHLDGISHINLKGLTDENGAQLLRERNVLEVKEGELAEISHAVDGNPLILKILPTMIEPWDEGIALEKLKEWKERFHKDFLAAGVLDEAAGDGREIINAMSVVPDALTKKNIVHLCADLNGGQWIGELHRRSLLEWDRESKLFYLHPAIAETAFEDLAGRPDELAAARGRAVGMYLKAGPGIDTKDQWNSIEDCQHLVRAAELMIDLGDFKNASHLVVTVLDSPLDRWGHWRLLRGLYEKLLALWDFFEEKPDNLLSDYAVALGNFGIMLDKLGDFDRAIENSQKHLAICQRVGDTVGVGRAYGNLGNAYSKKGEIDRAIEYHQKDLTICQQIGDVAGEGAACCNLGAVYNKKGDSECAIEYLKKCLVIFAETDNVADAGTTYGNLGNAYFRKGEFDRAIEYHNHHLTNCQKTGDLAGEGRAFGNLGDAAAAKGDHQGALLSYFKALKITKTIGAIHSTALWNYCITDSFLKLNKLNDAAFHSLSGLVLATQLQLYNLQDYISQVKQVRDGMSTEAFNSMIGEKFSEEESEEIRKVIELIETKQKGGD